MTAPTEPGRTPADQAALLADMIRLPTSVDGRFSVRDRVVVISGSGSGIGRATALVFAAQGASVVLVGRRVEKLEQVAAEIDALGGISLVAQADITDPAQCERVVEATLERFGQVDVLVNNAGRPLSRPPLEWSDDEWRDMFAINVDAAYYLTRAAGRSMLERGRGSIVNVSSTASINPYGVGVAYGAAKAALNNMTRSLAAAWGPHGIRVNTVVCASVRTENMDTALDDGILDIDMVNSFAALGRAAEPHEIATTTLFLASDAASFLTGVVLVADGGVKTPGT